MSRAGSICSGLAVMGALIAAVAPAGAQSSAPFHETGVKKAARVPGRKAVAAPTRVDTTAAPSGTIPMDLSGMNRNVQDVHSESHSRSNTMFNPQSPALSRVIPNATMKF